ncbi:hypothetical protein RHECNPAF_35000112 [Rhizobium etli CNPAF512]|nr:hypothetical protein RHECNPAF_35000112 [Rhizobium etli CNPAF512]
MSWNIHWPRQFGPANRACAESARLFYVRGSHASQASRRRWRPSRYSVSCWSRCRRR